MSVENQPTVPEIEISQLDEPTKVDNNSVLKPLDLSQKGPDMNLANKLSILLIGAAVVAGIGTGFGLNKLSAKSPLGKSSNQPISVVPSNGINNGDIFGSPDESTYKDTASGYLEKGGIDGEGSHKLLRVGGDSQTVYLTSSVTDLDKFVGMEIQIWGETFKAQTAGWLMDVGRIQVTNTQGQAPVEE